MKISGCCRIHQNKVLVNGKKYFASDNSQHDELSMQLYRFLKTEYPKFYKMDQQSKLAFLAAEILLKNENTLTENQDIALVFANKIFKNSLSLVKYLSKLKIFLNIFRLYKKRFKIQRVRYFIQVNLSDMSCSVALQEQTIKNPFY